MNLKRWTEQPGVSSPSARGRFRKVGRPRGPHGTGPVGHPLIRVEAQPDRGDAGGRTAVYARASSADQDRQVARATAGAAEHGFAVSGVVTEIGSAPKGRRQRGP